MRESTTLVNCSLSEQAADAELDQILITSRDLIYSAGPLEKNVFGRS